jgi:hypothetical protein
VLFVCLLPPLHKGALLVARHKMLATRGPRLPAWVAASIAASLLAGCVTFTPVPRKPLQEEGVRRLEQHHAKTMAGAARSRSPKRMSRFLTASCTSTANCILGEYCDLGLSGRRLFGAPAATGICRSNPPSPPSPPPPQPPGYQPMAFTTAASGSSINGAGQLSVASTSSWGLSYSSAHLMTTGVYEWSITAISLTPNTANSWGVLLGMIPTTQLSGDGLSTLCGLAGQTGASRVGGTIGAARPDRTVNVGDTAYFKFDAVQNKLFLREPLSSGTAPYVLLVSSVPPENFYVGLTHIAIGTWELKWLPAAESP